MKKIGIVICNYNKEDAVLDCIQSILESKFTDYDLYVVDNGSTDNSVRRIKEIYPAKLTLLENRENLGGSMVLIQDLKKHTKKDIHILCV